MRGVALALTLAACAPPPPGDGATPRPVDDTGTPPPLVEIVSPPETDAPPPTEPPLPAFGGRFRDLTSATWTDGAWTGVVDGRPRDSALLAFDVDGDGVVELIADGVEPTDPGGALHRAPVLRHDTDADAWVVDEALTRSLQDRSVFGVIGVADLDGDGHDDLLTAGTGPDDPLIRLADGDGGLVGGDVTLAVPRWFPLSVAYPVDLDADGWLDVLLGQACRDDVPPFTLLHRVGPRAWEERADLAVPDPQVGVRQLGIFPLGGDVRIAAMGYVCEGMLSDAPGVWRRTGTTPDGLPTFTASDPLPSDVWFRQIPDVAGAVLNDLAPMGGLVADPDGDGALDLLVASALEDVLVFEDQGGPALVDRTLDVDLRFPNLLGTNQRQPWSLAPLDLDLDGRPGLVIAQGADDEFVTMPADAHVSFPRVYWNDDGGFRELTDGLGLAEQPGDWHTLLLADVDDDLDADLLVGGWGRPPRVWRNELQPRGHRLVVRLRGTTSNHLGIGAVVTVEGPGTPTQTRLVGEAQPTNHPADPTLFLGTGAATVVDVVVRWPSGLVQRFDHLSAGRVHTLVEAPTLAVLDDDRVASADGASRVEVVVTPRRADGALDPSATVAVDQVGPATWDGPAAFDGTAWRRVLVAPAEPGDSRIVATIDGVPLTVRPRVRWTDGDR